MTTQLIQLQFNKRKGYDIGNDGRFQPETMTLVRRDQSIHPFTEELNELLETLTHEFLADFAHYISSKGAVAEPVMLHYSSPQLREKFVEHATIALVKQWCVQNQELVQELLVRASLRRYQLSDSRNPAWGERVVKAVNTFIEEAAEYYG